MIEYENLSKLNKEFELEFQEKFHYFLEEGWYILGKGTQNFEKEFANFLSAKECIGVGNGLDAMVIALKVLGFPIDSEIIVPSNTYIATILAVIQAGYKPVLVEPDINTYNIDPFKIEEKISNKTKAILTVHLYGKSCDMDPILEICNKYQLQLLEDCAQSHGALYKNQCTGTFGIGCFSFYPTKNLGALGDGGAIVLNNSELARKIRAFRNYGSEIKYENIYLGVNSRLDELQAIFLSVKLRHLNRINNHKIKLANLYFKNLSSSVIKPLINSNYKDVYHIFNIRHPKRDELREHLLNKNIKTEIHYPIPPHQQQALKGYFVEEYPISEEIHKTTLSLPISYFHSKEDILNVIEEVNSFVN